MHETPERIAHEYGAARTFIPPRRPVRCRRCDDEVRDQRLDVSRSNPKPSAMKPKLLTLDLPALLNTKFGMPC
ncbi:hypothetical protein EVAR_12183_1 [Eumeta japonica]|uniref:Uncharacterized protein n=1 Tax=Eumeta variegata TaxID=151549 RepID=A0A4C1UIJ2_EUMVA|nr:hypothetical protein EVAR_12183_1 [Eumeta japonica]